MENEVIKKDVSVQSQITIQPTPNKEVPVYSLPNIEIGIIPVLIGAVVFLVGIGVAWGALKTLVNGIKDVLEKNVLPDLKDVRERFGRIEDRVETLWKDKLAPANSPRQLNDKGNNILHNSGIKEIVDEKRTTLLELVKAKNVNNAYDAEIAIENVMTELPKHCPDTLDRLKDGAFRVGADIGGLLFVGSIYLRNQIFPDLGFNLDDLDKPKEVKKN